MKVLHATGKITPSKGQVMQLSGEMEAANNLGLKWDTKIHCPKGSNVAGLSVHFSSEISVDDYSNFFQKVLIWPKFRKDFYEWVKSQEDFYDVILLRYNFHDPYQYLYLKTATKPVYLIHHTKEVEELRSENGAIGLMRSILEKIIGKLCLQHAFGVIGVTQEIADYEKSRSNNKKLKALDYPNGTDTDSMPVLSKTSNEIPNLLFVAGMFAPWHGVDILLESIRHSTKDFKLHLIGKLEPEDLNLAKQDERVIVHGVLNRDEIPVIASQCDIAIDSLALNRKSMMYSCSLKTRDYLAMGLPVYSGCLDVFEPQFKYYKTDEPKIEKILAFASEMKEAPRQEVHDAAKPYIDKQFILNRFYNSLKDQV